MPKSTDPTNPDGKYLLTPPYRGHTSLQGAHLPMGGTPPYGGHTSLWGAHLPTGGTPPYRGGTPPYRGGTPPYRGGTPPYRGGTPPYRGGTPPFRGAHLPTGGTPYNCYVLCLQWLKASVPLVWQLCGWQETALLC